MIKQQIHVIWTELLMQNMAFVQMVAFLALKQAEEHLDAGPRSNHHRHLWNQQHFTEVS